MRIGMGGSAASSMATGANAAELIEAQLHPSTTSSMLDVAPEVKSAESSSASSESSGSSDGKRVIKLV
jgi:phosphoribosylformylglycinamidine (FGAM) synthase-like enzyme